MKVAIRVNVDRTNADGVIPLFEQLSELDVLRRVNVDLARVENYSDGPVGDQMFSSTEFVDVVNALYDRCAAERWPINQRGPRSAVRGVCQVDSAPSWVIDWTGDLRKCWAELGTPKGVVGTVKDYLAGLRPSRSSCELASRDPFDDTDCCACVFLPSCMGGCPKTRAARRAAGQKECPVWKYNFDRVLQVRSARERGSGTRA
jgi:uncharacterized protein